MADPRKPSPRRPSRFGPYPEYKDSGVEWLGKVPAHWSLKRLKDAVVRLEAGGTPESDNRAYWTDEDDGIPWVAISDMTRSFRVHETAKHITEEGRRSKRLRILPAGTLLYSMYASLGKVALLETQGVTNQAILGVVPRKGEMLRDYLRWWLEFMQAHVQMLSASNTQDNLSAERVRNMPVAAPIVIDEQLAITAFLERETAKIDTLVKNQERLIDLAQEKRTALIASAVTRGLNPNVPMKDSGVEWLGEIPAHWRLERLKTISTMRSGESITAASIDANGQYPVFGGHGLRGYTTDFTHDGEHVLVGRQGAHCGNVQATRGRFWASEHAVVVTPHRENVLEWIGAVLEAMDLNQHSVAAAQPGLALDRLRDLHVPRPPAEEQGAIAAALRHETSRIDALAAKVNEVGDRLDEYRDALIEAAVTGRIDVRKYRDRQADNVCQPKATS